MVARRLTDVSTIKTLSSAIEHSPREYGHDALIDIVKTFNLDFTVEQPKGT